MGDQLGIRHGTRLRSAGTLRQLQLLFGMSEARLRGSFMYRKLLLLAALALPSLVSAQTPAAVAAASYPAHDRRVLAGDIAEYTFSVRVGDGPFDEIALHRV